MPTAELAKAKGFNALVYVAYDGAEMLCSHAENILMPMNYNRPGGTYCSASTQALLARWLRETHHLHVNVQHNMHYCYQVQVQDVKGYGGTERTIDEQWLAHDYGTYEAALEMGLQLALSQLV